MDKLKFEITEYTYGSGSKPAPAVNVFINGMDLNKLAYEHEIKQAEKEPYNAGDYAPLYPEELYEELVKGYKEIYKEGKANVLGCTCGYTDCWPFQVTIDESENLVIWHSFRNPHRKWDYSDLGPFVFDKSEYYREIDKLILWMREEEPVKFDMELESLCSNAIVLKFTFEDVTMFKDFDRVSIKLYKDPVPDFIRAYLNLKMNQGYLFNLCDLKSGTDLSMCITIEKNYNVRLKVNIQSKDIIGGEEIDVLLDKGICLKMFEKLFRDIYCNKCYPYQFPFWDSFTSGENEKILGETKEHFERLGKSVNSNEFYEYQSKVIQERVETPEEIECDLYDYSRMLKTYEIPEDMMAKVTSYDEAFN